MRALALFTAALFAVGVYAADSWINSPFGGGGGGGGGGISSMVHSWQATEANLAVASPAGGPDGLGYSTNQLGMIVWHLDFDKTDAEYARFSFQRTPGLSTNVDVVVQAFSFQAGDLYRVVVQEVGQASSVDAVTNSVSTEVDVNNLLTTTFTNAIQTTAGEADRIYFDLSISTTADVTRNGDVSVLNVMAVEKP